MPRESPTNRIIERPGHRGAKAAWIGVAIAAVGLIAAYGQWLAPRSPAGDRETRPGLTPTATGELTPQPAMRFGANLAVGHSATASRTFSSDEPNAEQILQDGGGNVEPGRAVDGNRNTWWTSGGPAPQWIEIDLGVPRTVAAIRLVTAVEGPGAYEYRVYGRGAGDVRYTLFQVFRGERKLSVDSEVLTTDPSGLWLNIRYVRVETVKTEGGTTEGWADWREIEVLAPA